MIKNILILSTIMIILTTGCSSTTGKTSDSSASEVKKESGKVEYLTYDTFLTKVWNFESNPQNWVYEGEVPAIIDFYADWCAPCRKIAPIMEKIAKDYDGKLKVYKIDVDKEQKLAGVFQVRSIPSILFTPVSGQPMMQAGAMTEEMYVKIIEEQLLKK
ncbi:MAG: thioredoxin domain-containing protein [Bacteroidales bacterium]|nr:thioredoxin domain-containing protein [Bacteroidales bacterium]